MTALTWADLDPLHHTSFTFYNFLPGGNFRVVGAPPATDALERIARLLRIDLLEATDTVLDELAAMLISHGHELEPHPSMQQLADATAQCFARLIGDEARRPRRMRLTRLGLMLRTVLDCHADSAGVLHESVVPGKAPWDLVEARDHLQGWLATSDSDNLRRIRDGALDWSQRAGLPTQLDRLGDEGLWVGSCYTPGGYVVRSPSGPAPRIEQVAHAQPLILMFDAGKERWALDSTGTIFVLEGGIAKKQVMQLPAPHIHRARVIGDVLYAFDWSQVGVCFRVDLRDMSTHRMALGKIIVCNDICGHGDVLYAICKLQGKVFKMDRQGAHLDERLGAGQGPGRLLDPIMLRSGPEGLSVLNWFSAKLLRLAYF